MIITVLEYKTLRYIKDNVRIFANTKIKEIYVYILIFSKYFIFYVLFTLLYFFLFACHSIFIKPTSVWTSKYLYKKSLF